MTNYKTYKQIPSELAEQKDFNGNSEGREH